MAVLISWLSTILNLQIVSVHQQVFSNLTYVSSNTVKCSNIASSGHRASDMVVYCFLGCKSKLADVFLKISWGDGL